MSIYRMNCCQKGQELVAWAQRGISSQKGVLIGSAVAAIGLYAASLPLATCGVGGAILFGLSGRVSGLSQEERQQRVALASLPPHGISEEEGERLHAYIQEHLGEWEEASLPEGGLQIKKERSGLPRTLRILKENNELFVMILCNSKGDANTWKGAEATVKIAIDALTGQGWARRSRKVESQEEGLILYRNWTKIPPHPGISSPVIGSVVVQKKGTKDFCYECFTPLRYGNLAGILEVSLEEEEVLTLYDQLLDVLVHFERSNIEHGDLHRKNVLYWCDEQNRLRVEVTDFDSVSFFEDRNKECDLSEDFSALCDNIFRPLLKNNEKRLQPALHQKLARLNFKMSYEKGSAESFREEFLQIISGR